MPSVLWRSLCSLISRTFTNSRSWSFIIFSFPTQSGPQTLSTHLLCLLILEYGWRQNVIPLLKGTHPAPSQPGALRPEAGYQQSPWAPALHLLRGMARDCIPLAKVAATDWAGKKQKARRNLGWKGRWGSPDQPPAHTKEHCRVRPRYPGPSNCRVHGAAVPVAGAGAPAVRNRGTADVGRRARLQTQQKGVIYTV